MLNAYVQKADDKHYVDREVVSAIQRGDAEGYKKALEKYPEEERGLFDPFSNPMPLPKRDIAAELTGSITLDKDYASFSPGRRSTIPGTKDVRVEMTLKPEVKRDYAIKYLQDPEVQANVVSGNYKNLYKQAKDDFIKGGMKAEDATSEAMVRVVESMMPTYAEKGSAGSTTNIYNNNNMSPNSPTMQPLDSVPIVYKMNVKYDDGTSTVAETELTTGKYFQLSLAEKTSIPSASLRPIDGLLPGDKTAVMDVKQGALTSIPLVKNGSTIKFFDKQSGKNIVLKSGDPINQRFLDVLKETNPGALAAVSYSPVTIYAYETKNSNKDVIIKHGFVPASSSSLTAGLGNSKNTRQDIESMFTQVKAETSAKNKELMGLASSAKSNKKEEKPKQTQAPKGNNLIPKGTSVR